MITDRELQHGIVAAGDYAQIFNIRPGGNPDSVLSQALLLLSPFAALNPDSGNLTVVPVVANGSGWLLLANRGAQPYAGQLRLALTQLGLPARSYAATLSFPVPPAQSFQLQPSAGGWLAWTLALPAGGLQIWHLTPQ